MVGANGHLHAKARVYALANPQSLKQEERRIEPVFYDILRVSDPARYRVSVAETSGWIEYVDEEMLWRKKPAQLPEATEAKSRAEEFLRSLARRFAPGPNADLPEPLRTMEVVPVVRPMELVLVPRPNEPVWDHWLYRAQPQVVLGRIDRRRINVFGAAVEVRIGDLGQVIHYHARWRPIIDEKRNVDLVPITLGDNHHSEEAPRHDLVYLLEGDGIPQYYLSPYYVVNNGHTLTLESACAYSLTVAIARAPTNGGMSLTATVRGGSGDYAFQWAAYSIESVLEEGFRELGSGTSISVRTDRGTMKQSTIAVGPGSYVVMVNVRDRKTGAFRHHQQQIHSVPALGRASPLVASR